MATTNPPYRYDSLPTPDHTRIVELLPATKRAAPLQCRLVPLDLYADDPALRYEALSYTWGQPVFSEQLFIQGPGDDENNLRVLHITPSLASALRRLRRDSTVRRIWADAVCINQDDMTDKSRQIPLMSTIYCGASRVVVWLDPCGDGGSEARVRRLNALIRRRAITRHGLQGGAISEAANLLEQHFAMPWFSRRWIIQEVVGHPDVTLLCGEEEMKWLPLMALATSVFGDVDAAPAVVTSVLMMFNLWRMWVVGERRSGKCRLMNLLDRFGHFGCADGRDRIYALASLAEDGLGDDALVPISMDYSVSVEQLYTEFAEKLVNAGYLSWVLQQACARRCITEGGLPSWVPDWRVLPATKTLWAADTGTSRASVRPFGNSAHALTAILGSLRTWKPRTEEIPWIPMQSLHAMERQRKASCCRPVYNFWGEQFEIGDSGQTGEEHIDVFPHQVKSKSKEYPYGRGALAFREWILEIGLDLRKGDSEYSDSRYPYDAAKLASDLFEFLVARDWHRHHGSKEGSWLPAIFDREKLEGKLAYYGLDGELTAEAEILARDLGGQMQGRCIFSCEVRSPLTTPSSRLPSTVMFIGPSETRVGDRVMSLQGPTSRAQKEGRTGYKTSKRGCQWYVMREEQIQRASLFPSAQPRIPCSLPEFTGFRLVGDCFLFNTHRGTSEFHPLPSEFDKHGPWLWGPDKSEFGDTGMFLC